MRAYERLLNYVKVFTTSDEANETTPSTQRQFDLANQLVEEMKEIGISDVRVDKTGYVYGVIPATEGYEHAPKIGFIAHMDTAPDFSGENVKPQLIENYDGGDVALGESGCMLCVKDFPHLPTLKGRTLITTDGTTLLGADDKAGIAEIMTLAGESGCMLCVKDFPHLPTLKGRTLITTDGTTLLGADDKAGIAEIMTLAETLLTKNIPHGTVCIGFTPDEEIGRGADAFDVPGFGAEFAYTVDGGAENEIEYENFNACGAKVTIKGFSVHPGSSKDTMINASLVAMEFNAMLPSGDTPRDTDGYEGFFHLHDMKGDVSSAELDYIIRDHSETMFECRQETMRHIEKLLNEKYGAGTVSLEITQQYRNMKEKIEPCMHLIENAKLAAKSAGLEPKIVAIRGGTDGARLSFMGLPCPNLGTGGYAYHGQYEHITVEGMDKAVEVLKGIVELYAKQ